MGAKLTPELYYESTNQLIHDVDEFVGDWLKARDIEGVAATTIVVSTLHRLQTALLPLAVMYSSQSVRLADQLEEKAARVADLEARLTARTTPGGSPIEAPEVELHG